VTAPSDLPPLDDRPIVSAFMPARNAATTVGAAIASIRRQPAVDEIVIAVAPSTDGTREVVEALAAGTPTIRVIDNPAGYIPHALNLAARACEGEVLVRVDAHSVLPDGYVDTAIRVLRETGAANVGGRQRPVNDDGRFGSAVATAMASAAGSGGATYRTGVQAGPADTVFLGVFRKTALERVGWYDERFHRNEDAELNLRFTQAGYLVWFTPELEVDYRPRDDLRPLAKQYFANGRWRRKTGQVHPGSLTVRQLLPPAVAVTVAASLATALVTRRASALLPAAGYGAALLAEGWRLTRRRDQAARVGAALATMHLSFGAGFLVGPPELPDDASTGRTVPGSPTAG
jgi:succinoglycan biosynthesis protein ExoA